MKLTASGIENNSGNIVLRSSGSIINVTTLNWSSEVSLSGGASGVQLTSSFTKIGGTESNIIVIAQINGSNRSAGVCGTYISIAGTPKYTFTYMYDNWSNGEQKMEGWDIWTGLTAGSKTVEVGWSTNNGEAGNKPWDYVNPSAGRGDSRKRAQGSNVIIFEVKS